MGLLYYIPAERVAYVVGIANAIVSAILLFGAIASLNHIQATHGDTPGSRGALHDNLCCFQLSIHKREVRSAERFSVKQQRKYVKRQAP